MALRTLIVDDNGSFLAAARTILDGPEFSVVGALSNSADALRAVDELQPELILLDIDLGEESGFELARQITERIDGTGPRLVLTSIHAEEEFADLIDESPALGFVPKSDLSPRKLADVLSDA